MHITTFDLEILTPVEDCPDKWAGAIRGDCGVSIVCIWDNKTNRPHLYGPQITWDENGCPQPIDLQYLEDAMKHLNASDMVIGFNSSRFDVPIMESLTDIQLDTQQYDILDATYKSLGKRTKGYSLNELAFRTLGRGKNNSGKFATALAASGEWATLHDYCLNDVALTRDLATHIYTFGYVMDINGDPLYIDNPFTEVP